VSVRLPFDAQRDKVHMDIEHEGELKNLSQFGTIPVQKLAL